MQMVTLNQFLSDREIRHAVKLFRELGSGGRFIHAVEENIIRPNLDRINAALGQENDPTYLAYAIEYVLTKASNE